MSTILSYLHIYLKKFTVICAAEPGSAVIYHCMQAAFRVAVGDTVCILREGQESYG